MFNLIGFLVVVGSLALALCLVALIVGIAIHELIVTYTGQNDKAFIKTKTTVDENNKTVRTWSVSKKFKIGD